MESVIRVKASATEMRSFFDADHGVRCYEQLPGGYFKVRYRGWGKLNGTFTIEGLKKADLLNRLEYRKNN